MVVVLLAAAAFVYLRLRADLDETIEEGLRSRSGEVATLIQRSEAGLRGVTDLRVAQSDESIVQVLTTDGGVVGGTTGVRAPALRAEEAADASADATLLQRHVPGLEGEARLLVRTASASGRPYVLVVGTSLEDRDEALGSVLASFLIGGAVAVLVASGAGYLLATAGLAPVEAMRQRAKRISLSRGDERLPLPAAHDEVRRLGETLNEMLARLRASFERERRFVADASHELRTPLAVLKTELETLLRSGQHEPDVRQSLIAAVEETDHLSQLAEDLLLIARAAEGRLPVRLEEVDVAELLERARDRFADRAAEQGRRIQVLAPRGLSSRLDPLRGRQALGNLIDNALRHGAGEIHLAARRDNGGLELDVSDQGAGFPADLAPQAFERFTRGATERSRGGTGLGLAIVRVIAEAHGGTATIVGAGAKSTTVRLRLPPSGE